MEFTRLHDYPEVLMRESEEECQKLPDELTLYIFQYLDFTKPNATKLSLVCRQWRRIVADKSLCLQRLKMRNWTKESEGDQAISQIKVWVLSITQEPPHFSGGRARKGNFRHADVADVADVPENHYTYLAG